MRWDDLFDDLEAQLRHEQAAALRDEINENLQVERATQDLEEVLCRLQGSAVHLQLAGGRELAGQLGPAGPGYFCVEESRMLWVIRCEQLRQLQWPGPLPPALPQPADSSRRPKLAAVLRQLMRDRARTWLWDREGSLLAEGSIVQAAKDFVLLAAHAADEFPTRRTGRSPVLIPLEAIGSACSQLAE